MRSREGTEGQGAPKRGLWRKGIGCVLAEGAPAGLASMLVQPRLVLREARARWSANKAQAFELAHAPFARVLERWHVAPSELAAKKAGLLRGVVGGIVLFLASMAGGFAAVRTAPDVPCSVLAVLAAGSCALAGLVAAWTALWRYRVLARGVFAPFGVIGGPSSGGGERWQAEDPGLSRP